MARRRTKRQRAARIANERARRQRCIEVIETHGIEHARNYFWRQVQWLERYCWMPNSPFRNSLRKGHA